MEGGQIVIVGGGRGREGGGKGGGGRAEGERGGEECLEIAMSDTSNAAQIIQATRYEVAMETWVHPLV